MSQYRLDAFSIEQAGIAPGPLDAYRGRGIHTRPDVVASKEEKKKAVEELVSQGMNAQRAHGTKLIPKTIVIDIAGNEVTAEPMRK